MLNSKEKKSNLEMSIKLITGHFNNKSSLKRCKNRAGYIHMPSMLIQSAMTRLKIFQWILGKVSCRRKLL